MVAALCSTASAQGRLTESDFRPIEHEKAALGRLLFYDPVLSGNKNISCGTCHHHRNAGADQVSLGIGEGGTGIGIDRTLPPPGVSSQDRPIRKRVPRNTPALFNLGARQIDTLFHDGRLSRSDLYGNGFNSPAEEFLPAGLDSLLGAQALFPLTSATEMAGQAGENAIAGAANDRIDKAWDLIAARVRHVAAYGPLFSGAFQDVSASADVTIVHIANALGAFIDAEWRSHDSRWDAHLAGHRVLSTGQMRGADLFFGKAGCSGCHSGALFTDQKFHALALPPIGPGRTRAFDPVARDVGRMGETDRLEDAYRFRTPSLRNVALTAPYGHNGAYATLDGIIRHHLQPIEALDRWTPRHAILPSVPQDVSATDFATLANTIEMIRLRRSIDIEPVDLDEREIADIVDFLHSLTGGSSIHGRLGRPEQVPSGLKVD
ncbi:MAG: cytochrome c peroxidase [Pseudomonadota bacterium]